MRAVRTRVLEATGLALVTRPHLPDDPRLEVVVAEVGARDGDEPVGGAAGQVRVLALGLAHVAHARLAVLALFAVAAARQLAARQRLAELDGHVLC